MKENEKIEHVKCSKKYQLVEVQKWKFQNIKYMKRRMEQ
jgi:hypothetical protein